MDVWKENTLEDLEVGLFEYELAGEFFSRNQERVWRRKFGISESSRVKEVGAERKNNKGVCTEV